MCTTDVFQSIFHVILEGHLQKLEDYLEKCAVSGETTLSSLLNDVTHRGLTPLGHAVHQRNIRSVKLLLKYGADAKSLKNWDLIHTAVEFNDLELVQCLVSAGMSVNTVDPDGLYHTPLTRAVRNKNLEAVRLLLECGAEVNKKGYRRGAPIHMACSLGWMEGLDLLLKHGADPCITYDFNCKPVYPLGKLPAEAWECVDLLLASMKERGLSQDQWRDCLQVSLIPAIRIRNDSLVKYLLETTASQRNPVLFLQGNNGVKVMESLLATTAGFCSVEIAKFFLESGASADAGLKEEEQEDNCAEAVFRNSAVFQATTNQRTETLKLLIKHGAHLTCTLELKESALMGLPSALLTEAVQKHFQELAVVLLVGNCKPMVSKRNIYSSFFYKMFNFLEMYIFAGGLTYSIFTWLNSHQAMLDTFPTHSPAIPNQTVVRLRSVLAVSKRLEHTCRTVIRTAIRQNCCPLATGVELLPLPNALKTFMLLEEEEQQLLWT